MKINIDYCDHVSNPFEYQDDLKIVCFYKYNQIADDYSNLDKIQDYIQEFEYSKEQKEAIESFYRLEEDETIEQLIDELSYMETYDNLIEFFKVAKIEHHTVWTEGCTFISLDGEHLCKTFKQFADGEVYFYELLDDDGEILDSCYEYYDLEHCQQEAQRVLEYYKSKRLQKRIDRIKILIKSKVPLNYR
jgi:hypothetical protein